MLTASVLAGLAFAALRGGDLRRLGGNTIKLWWVLVLAFMLKYLAQSGNSQSLGLLPYAQAIHIASYATVIGVLLLNHNLPWTWLMALGVAMNLVVVGVNSGQMPVATEALQLLGKDASLARLLAGTDPMHTPTTASTVLGILGDWIPVPGPFSAIVSPGDVVMAVGVILLIYKVSRPEPAPANESIPSPSTGED